MGRVRFSHRGEDKDLLESRKLVYKQAKEKNPLRWSGELRKWEYIKEVELNPDRSEQENAKAA